jgi:hypothetical protein
MASASISVITDLLLCNNIPIFVIETDKEMETTIIRIGNSRGIIIPAAILKKLGVKEGAKVKLEESGKDTVTLSFIPEEEPYTGPFTGPFKDLCYDPEAWGGRDMDPVEYVRMLRSSEGKEKRIIPEW